MKSLTKQDNTRSLVFCKTRPEKIDESNVENAILVLSVTDTPAETVYNALNQLYVPLLEAQHSEVGRQMQALVEELGGSQENPYISKFLDRSRNNLAYLIKMKFCKLMPIFLKDT